MLKPFARAALSLILSLQVSSSAFFIEQPGFLSPKTATSLAAALDYMDKLAAHLDAGRAGQPFEEPLPAGLQINAGGEALAALQHRPGVMAVLPSVRWQGKTFDVILSNAANPFVFPVQEWDEVQIHRSGSRHIQLIPHSTNSLLTTAKVRLLERLLENSGWPAGSSDSKTGLSAQQALQEVATLRAYFSQENALFVAGNDPYAAATRQSLLLAKARGVLQEFEKANPDKIRQGANGKSAQFAFQDLVLPDQTFTLITQKIAAAAQQVRRTIEEHFHYLGSRRAEEPALRKSLRAKTAEIYRNALEGLRLDGLTVDIEPLDSPEEIFVNGGAGTVVGVYRGEKKPENLVHYFYILYGPKTTLITPTATGLQEFSFHAHNGVWVNNRTRFNPANLKKGKGKTIADGGVESQKPFWWKKYVAEKLPSNKMRYTESPVYSANEILMGADKKEGFRNNGGILSEAMPEGMAHPLGRLIRDAGGDYIYHGGRLYAGSADLIADVRKLAENDLENAGNVTGAVPVSAQDIMAIPAEESPLTLEDHLHVHGLSENVRSALLTLIAETISMQRNLALIPAETVGVNTSGDNQKAIDIVGHENTTLALQRRGRDGRAPVCAAISEEPTYCILNPDNLADREGKVHFQFEGREESALGPNETQVETNFVPIPSGKGVFAAYDPLDGSSKIDTNGGVGFTGVLFENDAVEVTPIDIEQVLADATVAGVFDRNRAKQLFQDELLKREKAALKAFTRENLRCSFFVLYGSVTTLVLASRGKVYLYTLRKDPVLGIPRFVLWSREPIRVPEEGPTLAVGGVMDKQLPATREHILDELREGKTCGYGGSMVGDVVKVLLRGGLFAYPMLLSDAKEAEKEGKYNPKGKLRTLVEASIAADILLQAGGEALTVTKEVGIGSPLDIQPKKAIEKVPPIVGSRDQAQRFALAVVEDLKRMALDPDGKNKSAAVAETILSATAARLKGEATPLSDAVSGALAQISAAKSGHPGLHPTREPFDPATAVNQSVASPARFSI